MIREGRFGPQEAIWLITITITLITFLFVVAMAVLNLLGLEIIARFSKIFAYTMVAGFIIVVILGQSGLASNNCVFE